MIEESHTPVADTAHSDTSMFVRNLEIGTNQWGGPEIVFEDCYDDLDDWAEREYGGGDAGALVVRLHVDHDFHQVITFSGQTADLDLIDQAIGVLGTVRDRLQAFGGNAKGQCLGQGDYGRCKLPTGHADECDLPTKEEHDAQILACIERAARRSGRKGSAA